MHSFVTAVLLGFSRLDSFRTDPSRIHQALSRVRRARPIAKGVPLSERMGGKAELAEKPLMNTGSSSIDVEYNPLHSQQESTEAVLDGEGIAVAAVEHLELPFEVDGPDRIRLIHGGERLAGMARFAGASTLLRDQIVTLENTIDRSASWCPAELHSCEFADLA